MCTEPLGGGIRIYVSDAHHFTTDTILLAHFAGVKNGERVVELGTGCGTIPLLMIRDASPKTIVAIDVQEEAIALLEEGVDFILAQAKNFNKKRYLDVPLLRDYSFGYGHDGNAEYHDLKGKLQRFVSGDALKALKKHTRYAALVEKVSAIQ
jgi:hypothetical protein